MASDKSLKAYNKKRDFTKTSEPPGEHASSEGMLKFFVQQHAASRMHYDFRLEFGGCLKSWAVPKGPSLNPLDQRLAVHVEDHPLAYGCFEGKIPSGNYGAGTVLLWDQGCYVERSSKGRDDSELAMISGFAAGRLTFVLDGVKLKGEFALIRLKNTGSWLLLKKRDQEANYKLNILESNKSVISGLNISDLERQNSSDVWIPEKSLEQPKLGPPLQAPVVSDKDIKTNEDIQVNAKDHAHYGMIRPILGTTYKFDHSWIFYLKIPCHRAIAHTGKWSTKLYSHAKISYKERFAPAFKFLREISGDFVFECEIAVFDETCQQYSEQLLRDYHLTHKGVLTLMITDLLVNHDEDLRSKPFCYRLKQLKNLGIFNEKILLKPEIHKEELEHHELGDIEFLAKHHYMAYRKGVSTGFIQCRISQGQQKERYTAKVSEHTYDDDDEDASKFVPSEFSKLRSTDHMQFTNGPMITQLSKILWPKEKYSKDDLILYYESISKLILPYIKNRPISMHRHPKGVIGESFFQKDLTGFVPSWFETIRIKSSKKGFINYPLCQNEFSLLYLANLYCIELNPWMSLSSQLEYPDQVYIDLDPSEGNSFIEIVEVACHIRDVLKRAKMRGFCKTSGSRGLHIMIPLIPRYSFSDARALAKKICEVVVARLPTLTSIERAKSKRKGKIYLDFMQNYYGQTLASVYCVRPVAGALVSAPIKWSEVNESLDPQRFNMKSMISRLNQVGDLWNLSTKVKFDVKECLKNLENVD